MLKKENMIVGNCIVVHSSPKDGVTFMGKMTPTQGLRFVENQHVSSIGTTLQVIKKPRVIAGYGNCIKLRDLNSGFEGEVYWCEAKHSCDLV
jgi:hypothetical protein